MTTIGQMIGQEEGVSGVKIVRNNLPTVIIAEGRVTEIRLDPHDATDIRWHSSEQEDRPVVLCFFDEGKEHYLITFDHRRGSRESFKKGKEVFFRHFGVTPCLASFRWKEYTYLVLTDIDDNSGPSPVKDGGPEQAFVLARKDELDMTAFHVLGKKKKKACHKATGICLAEPRPKKVA